MIGNASYAAIFVRTTLRIQADEGLLCDERSVLRGVKWEHIGRPDWVTVALWCAFDANEDEIEDSPERIEVLHVTHGDAVVLGF